MNKWDLYDKNFNKSDKVINENDDIPDDLYHYSVNIWMVNSKHQLLLVRNTLNYNIHYPGFWNSVNGNVLSGEAPIECCIRSVNDKIGIELKEEDFEKLDTKTRDPYHYIYETYVVKKDINLSEIKFNDETCVQAKWVDLKEVYNMIENGEIAWVMIGRLEEYIIKYLKETNQK